MDAERIKIPRTSDLTIVDFFKELGAQFNVSQAHVSALGFNAIGSISLCDEPSEEWRALLEHDAFLINTMQLMVPGLTVAYVRGGQYSPENKSPIYDEIVLHAGQEPGATIEKLDTVALINKRLNPFEPKRIISGTLTDEQQQLLAIHHGTLERLERLTEDIIRQNVDYRNRLQSEYDQRSKTQDETLAAQRAALDEEFKQKALKLESERTVLEEKRKLIDDRDNTHARREIRDKMLEDVKQRVSQFGVSKATEQKRSPVFGGIALLVLAFAALIVWTGVEISTMERYYMGEALQVSSSVGIERGAGGVARDAITKAAAVGDHKDIYWLWARLTIYSIGLIATILFYIKWQNKWAEQHSSHEFQLRQFQIDISRANWVIESGLEWRKETQSVIPAELLNSITRNLFINANIEPEQVLHPSDELASALLGSASKLKLRIGENELDFDKPAKIPNKA